MHMHEVTIICGMTETSPVSTQTAVDDPLEKQVSTVGRVHPHAEVKIVDPATGATVPRGTPGEQCTRGYSVTLGYWEDHSARLCRPRGHPRPPIRLLSAWQRETQAWRAGERAGWPTVGPSSLGRRTTPVPSRLDSPRSAAAVPRFPTAFHADTPYRASS